MNVDPQRSEVVIDTATKTMELEPPNIGWMTHECADQLHGIFYSAFTYIQMEMLKQGVDQDQAKEVAQRQAPLLAFQLGMQVGRDMEAARAMREMFGE